MSRIPLGQLRSVGLLVAAAWFLGPELVAQEADSPPAGTVAGDRVQPVFEREVFSYPSFERRNPFRALTGDDLGPRFEDMVLMGVVLSPRPETSIAVLGARPPGSANDQAATRLLSAALRRDGRECPRDRDSTARGCLCGRGLRNRRDTDAEHPYNWTGSGRGFASGRTGGSHREPGRWASGRGSRDRGGYGCSPAAARHSGGYDPYDPFPSNKGSNVNGGWS